MRNTVAFGSSLFAALAFAVPAGATVYYASPTGTATSGCTCRESPCDLGSAANLAAAGDIVNLMDGVYKTQLYVKNSGTADAWITFQADECATPIIEGPGVAPDADNQDSGIGSQEATYVKFIGLVSRGWSSGFSNGWTGNVATDSNGNWEIINCLADGNGRTGFTFFSAQGYHLKNSIASHNGSSTLHSWSSGITLYSTPGGALIEGNIAFENMDAEKHTDGSGFIVNESSHGAKFVNNLAFRNGGSCLRLTKSKSTKFINNTCYHDSQDSADTGPTNPGEVYFTQDSSNWTTTDTLFTNNVFVATGTGPGAMAIYNQPTPWNNNVVKTGTVSYFTAADSDYTLASGAMTDLVGKGATGADVPTNDVGFDPKCIVKKTPVLVGMIASASWYQNSVDVDYIKSIGGVGACFHPKARSGTPDIGAYANGAVMTATAGSCTPKTTGGGVCEMGTGGMGAGGMDATGGTSSAAGGMSTGTGGTPAAGGAGPGAGGAMMGTGGAATGGTAAASGGTTSTGTGGTATSGAGAPTTGNPGAGAPSGSTTGGASNSGGTTSGTTSSGGTSSNDAGGDAKSGCGCRVANEKGSTTSVALGLAGLALLGVRRRRTR